MSAAAAATAPGAPAPAKKGKKKLLILIVAVVLVLAIAGGAALVLLKKKPVDADGEEAPAAAHAGEAHGDAKVDLKHPPAFLPLDPFVVNLADREVERYAQVGVTFEVADAKFAEEIKPFMPAIRNGILMILSHKTSKDLLDREGKEKLAGEIQRESARTLGIEVEDPDEEEATEAKPAADAEHAKPKKKKKKRRVEPNPIRHVHFSNFIVQ